MIATPVKRFDLLWILRMNAGHEPDHFAPGHLGVNAFLDDAAARELTEYTGNIAVFRPEIRLHSGRLMKAHPLHRLQRVYIPSSYITSNTGGSGNAQIDVLPIKQYIDRLIV